MMKRNELAREVHRRLEAQDLVVCGLGATEAAFRSVQPRCHTYFASDPMGAWSSVALGLALAQPQRRVFLLAGDGDLLMSLPSLATIAQAGPANLRIVVFQNGAYSSTGGQRLAVDDRLDFAAVARGVGFAHAVEVRAAGSVAEVLDALAAARGPALVSALLEDEPCPAAPAGAWSQVEERTMFMRALLGPQGVGSPAASPAMTAPVASSAAGARE